LTGGVNSPADLFRIFAAVLLIARCAAELWLERLNRRHVLANSSSIPELYRGLIDEPTFQKSNAYTLAKNQLHQINIILDNILLAVVLFTGVLPLMFRHFIARLGASFVSLAAFMFVIGLVLALFDLPLSWYGQFRLEQRFGFNTTTQRTWWLDRFKTLALSVLLGYPLLLLVLKLIDWMGQWWWLWVWAVMIVFQLIIGLLAPVLIMPLFNKFTPLPEGPLRQRLLGLAERTRFRAGSIQVMDGSKRSRHSNAFFTGFGRFRKIVLFDTLIQQLAEPELEAVLAHEIGHYKKKHLPKMLLVSAVLSLAGLYLLSLLAREGWFFRAFGFDHEEGQIALALLLFGLLSGLATFWFSPLGHWWSRRYEYQADAYARDIMSEADSLIGALRKLNEKNLSNLIPHPFYSRFYYSHPTLLEREKALRNG
jgi:STE24 endopeptidase